MDDNNLNYSCLHEGMLQDHSLKINALEKEVSFKKEKLDDLKKDNEEIKLSLKELNASVNEIILASKDDDDKLDKRLLKIETRLETTEQLQKQNSDDFNLKLGIITVIFLALTFYFNFIHHL